MEGRKNVVGGKKKAASGSSSTSVAASKKSEDESVVGGDVVGGNAKKSKGTAKKKRRTYPYIKCSCVYCSAILSCKSSLSRHLATCGALKHLLDVSPQSVSLNDVLTRKRQLEILEKVRERKKEKTFTTCSFCSDVIDAKSLNLHLSKVHNFPVV